jgi:uncharacterized protein (TIGR02217 family)
MPFHEVRFPTNMSFGSIGGPERRTEIVTLANGFEERNTRWAHSRRRFDAGVGMRSLDDVETLIAFFEARQGQLFAFRWKDWSDFKSSIPSQDVQFQDQVIGTGDGVTTQFQLSKTYTSGAASYRRPIGKPVLGTISVGIEGDIQTDTVHYTVDTFAGLVTFDLAPEEDAAVTAGFEFDVPVRFDTDGIKTSLASFKAGDVPDVPVVEVRI